MSDVKDNNEINYPLSDAEKDDDGLSEDEKEIQYQRDLKRFLIPQLRRATYRWPARNQALVLARVGRGLYECATCKEQFKKEETDIDHTDPVVSVKEGWTNWADYIRRILPPVEGWQILCKQCHSMKTDLEDSIRAVFNAKRKAIRDEIKEKEKEQKKREKEAEKLRVKAEKKAAKGK